MHHGWEDSIKCLANLFHLKPSHFISDSGDMSEKLPGPWRCKDYLQKMHLKTCYFTIMNRKVRSICVEGGGAAARLEVLAEERLPLLSLIPSVTVRGRGRGGAATIFVWRPRLEKARWRHDPPQRWHHRAPRVPRHAPLDLPKYTITIPTTCYEWSTLFWSFFHD